MDPREEYPSDSEASDEDFQPEKEVESGSEVESDHDSDHDSEPENADKKRKRLTKTAGTKRAKFEAAAEESPKDAEELDEDEEERMTDALWADFLSGTGNSNSPASTSKQPAKSQPVEAKAVTKTVKPTVTKVFEFAGETVEVTESPKPTAEDVVKSASKPVIASPNTIGGTPRPLGNRPLGGGLGAVLGQLGKKNKLSTLEKTQLDWKSFKRTEGIEEELQTHNRGKDGYLERQDFLQRADVRQFEIEKQFRQSKSKR